MKTKKIVSLLLAALIACSVFAGLSVSAEEVAHTYTAVGTGSFLGGDWDPAAAANHLEKQDDGTYAKEYTGVAAGQYIIKVAEDDAWDVSFGATVDDNNNIEYIVPEDDSIVKIILTVEGTKDVKDEDGNVTGTQTAGYVTVLVNGSAAEKPTEPEETFHVVAGAAELCNGVAWDPADKTNEMTKNADGTYEITFTNIPVGEYEFKVTTNGAWDKGDWNLTGDARFGGPNAVVTITEADAPATVKVTLNEEDGYAKAYINDKLVEVEVTEPTTKEEATIVDNVTSGVLYKEGGYYYPSTGVATERLYFAMPTSWKTFSNAAACAYWWTEPDANPSWQESYLLRDAGTEIKVGDDTRHVYYIDAAKGIGKIIFNNGIDGGVKPAEGEEATGNWGKNFQTKDLAIEGLEKGEDPNFPDGLESFENMIYIVDESDTAENELSGTITYGGAWNYFHADSTYDLTPGTTYEVKDEVKVPVTGIKVSPTSKTLAPKGTVTLTATITPNDASNKEVTWTTSNSKVATVNAKGKVTANAAGTATITVTTADGSFKATSKITVKQPVTSVTLNKKTLNLKVKQKATLTTTIKPTNATTKTVAWTTSKKTVATVSAKGVVTAKARGTATVKATAKDGSNKSASCKVTVTQPVTKITLNKTKATLKVKKTLQLKVKKITPTNANNKAVKWSSSKAKVAKVSTKGKVTALKAGTAVIKATAKDGSKKSASCKITVKKK
ncbi:MAG: Ig-like domain-containing protein [Ruminococcus sp.]|nr:Ig-like domain-containing protein [Ruminococcus sp.]